VGVTRVVLGWNVFAGFDVTSCEGLGASGGMHGDVDEAMVDHS
jgi:hypothetical protein